MYLFFFSNLSTLYSQKFLIWFQSTVLSKAFLFKCVMKAIFKAFDQLEQLQLGKDFTFNN